MGAPLTEPCCSLCGRVLYRHPIVIWALQCIRCDRAVVWLE
jgi:hypothetical protein